MTPFQNPAVAQAFEAYPPSIRPELLALRELIFRTAASMPGVGELEEALKWGEPAYLTSRSKSGSTIRIGWKAIRPAEYAMYFNCQTTLVDTFRSLFPHELQYQGNRGIVLQQAQPVPVDTLAFCVSAALTYHRQGKGGSPSVK